MGDPEERAGGTLPSTGAPPSEPLALLEGLQQVLALACAWAECSAGLLLQEEAGLLYPVIHLGLEDGVVPPSPLALQADRVPDSLLGALSQALPQWAAWPLDWQGRCIGWMLLGGREPLPPSVQAQPESARYVQLASLLLLAWEEASRRGMRLSSAEEVAASWPAAGQVAAAIGDVRSFQEKTVSAQWLGQLIEQCLDLTWITDREGRLLFTNQVTARAMGYDAESWLGKELWPLLLAEDIPRARELLQETLAGREQHCEVRVCDRAGHVHHLEVNTAPLRAGDEIVGTLGFARDVSERWESEQTLLQRTRQAEKRAALLRAIGEVSRQVLTLLNPMSLLQSAVDSLVDNLGYDYASVLLLEGEVLVVRASAGKSGHAALGFEVPLGQGITGWAAKTGQLYVSNDVVQDVHYFSCADLADTRSELALPIRNTTEVCGVLDVLSTVRGAFDEADTLALSSLADQLGVALENAQLLDSLHERMAELELARARLSQAEKLSALGELIANAAHELNNPLTSVIGYAQLLQSSLQEEEALRDLGTIIQSAQRAARIVEDLLTFARQRVPAIEPADVNDLIRQTVRVRFPKLAQERIRLELHLAPDVLPVRADSGQLEQVLVNLILNARQALLEGPGQGRITLRTSLYEVGARAGRWVRIEVSDDGPGMPEETLLRIFDPFFTTRENLGATGMGLSICYGIVVRHGGLIWAESTPGKGAHFFVELPVWQEDVDVPPEATT